MACEYRNNIFALHIMAGVQDGLALVVAANSNAAFTALKNQGVYKNNPSAYTLLEDTFLGSYSGDKSGLIWEEYTDFETIYDVIFNDFKNIVDDSIVKIADLEERVAVLEATDFEGEPISDHTDYPELETA